MRLEPIVGSAQMMPNSRNYTIKSFNTWEIKWMVLTIIINDKVGTKVQTRIKIVVEKTVEVEIGEIGRWTKIDMCLPMIIHAQKNQVGLKEVVLKTCLQGSTTRLKGLIRC